MKRWIAMLAAVVVSLAGAGRAYAQESVPGAGAVVITVIPVGGTFFTEGKNTKAPSFGNYGVGGAVEVHFNKFLSVEGDVISALGVTLIAVPHALGHLERRALVRLVPQWYADSGPISIYYPTRTLLPAKTRVFVDFVIDGFRRDRLAERFAGSLGEA